MLLTSKKVSKDIFLKRQIEPSNKGVSVWFSVFGRVRIGGKETWTWRSLGPAFSLQAQDQPSQIGKKKKRRKEKKKNCLTNKNFLSLEWGICFPLSDLHAMFLSYTQLSDLLVTDLTSK